MVDTKIKTYNRFDWAITVANFGLALNVFWLAGHLTATAPDSNIAVINLGLAFAQVAYRLSLYFSVAKRSAMAASLINTALAVTSLGVIIINSGGFSSPYYPLWLLLILVIGIYRASLTFVVLTLTSLYFATVNFETSWQNLQPSTGTSSSITALIASYMIAVLGFWLWHDRTIRITPKEKLRTMSNQLNKEHLTSEILLHYIGEGVMVIDMQLRVQLLNPGGQQLTGWPENEAKGIDGRIVLPLLNEQAQTLLGPDNPFTHVIRRRRGLARDDIILATRSQKKLPISLLLSPIFDDNQNLIGVIAVFRDITQAKAAERQRNEFISTASHEMRTPVAAVEGYISLALNSKVAKVDDRARTYLTKAQTSIEHLGKLFQDLLATTRIEEGKIPNHPQAVEIVSLINQVIEEMRFKAKSKGLTLKLKTGGQVGSVKSLHPLYYVLVDPERIREVLINLVDNGLKFTRRGSVNLTIDGDSQQVTIGVEDTGLGIAPEDITHLFQKFYRVDNSRIRDIGGTGLGLYISRAIVELYQGRIWVESRLGIGSHFKFSLPRLDYAKAQRLLAHEQQVSQSPKPPTPAPVPLVASNLNHQVE